MRPLLYPPDVVSLILLAAALILLRRVAVAHLEVEVARLAAALASYSRESSCRDFDPARSALERLFGSVVSAVDRLTPARLVFVRRTFKKLAARGGATGIADLVAEFDRVSGAVAERRIREKLSFLRSELLTTVGLFFALGSLSGCVLFAGLLLRVVRRGAARPAGARVDRMVDLIEKVLPRLGTKAYRLAAATKPEAL